MTFKMYGAREIVKMSSGTIRIEKQIKLLEDSISENPGLVFDMSKTLIETVCKTILKDKGVSYTNKDDLPRLIKDTIKSLNIGKNIDKESKNVEESLKRIVNGLTNMICGICEIRNYEGFASHGKEADHWSERDSSEVYLVARAADAIVNYLFKIHVNIQNHSTEKKLEYRDCMEFNDYIDEANDPIIIFGLPYKLSEIFFSIDIKAYKEYLNNFIDEEK